MTPIDTLRAAGWCVEATHDAQGRPLWRATRDGYTRAHHRPAGLAEMCAECPPGPPWRGTREQLTLWREAA